MPICSDNVFFDENNYLLDISQLNLDESESQEDNKFHYKFERDEANIEIQNQTFYRGDIVNPEEKKILFFVKQITPGRGRKRKKIEENINSVKKHDKYCDDNIKRKIQVHFINFIRKLINQILVQLGYEEKLHDISSLSKQNENKKKFSLLKNMTIEQILSQDISPKYKKEKNKKINVILMDKILKFVK